MDNNNFTIPVDQKLNLQKIKSDIITKINEIEIADAGTHYIFDKLYTLLYNDELVDKVIPYLQPMLESEYSQKDIDDIVAKFISIEELDLAEKNEFLTNFSTNKCVNSSLLLKSGHHSMMDVFYQSNTNYQVFMNFVDFGVGKHRAGKGEHAFAILANDITQKGKGDIDVKGVPVELKIATGTGSGRLGEGGVSPEKAKELISKFPEIDEAIRSFQTGMHKTVCSKGTVDNPQKSVNLVSFVQIVNETKMNEKQREQLGNEIFGNVFGPYGQPITEIFKIPGVNSREVLNAYIESNFDWYKSDPEMGGAWEYLVSIGIKDKALIVAKSGKELVDLVNAKALKSNIPAIIPTQDPEVYYQVNPSRKQ